MNIQLPYFEFSGGMWVSANPSVKHKVIIIYKMPLKEFHNQLKGVFFDTSLVENNSLLRSSLL